jgi:hypothetical protein
VAEEQAHTDTKKECAVTLGKSFFIHILLCYDAERLARQEGSVDFARKSIIFSSSFLHKCLSRQRRRGTSI